eukprot:TRINITY_DN5139_c0_g1_i1.p1 TRINITY_DN5139_c0_g1~~TRINITY_DN5139_c0_g1_i1.p1  ORF type:complete len:604 (+),score=158.38 TRINITY_DN5139_c0_g1_i1:95-1906(+)
MDKNHFTELPEPPTRGDDVINGRFSPKIEYLDSLEQLAATLHKHLLAIQKEEAKARNNYSKKLEDFPKGGRDKKSLREEADANKEYDIEMRKIKDRRKYYRELLFKAQKERKKLIESMRIQKAEDEYVSRKIQQINSLDSDAPTRSPRWDLFSILLVFVTILTIVIYVVATDYDDHHDSVLNNGFTNRIADFFTFFFHISLFVLLGFGLTYTFMRKYAYSALGFGLLAAVFAFAWTILYRIFWDNIEDGGDWERGNLTIWHMINALYGSATVLIAFGAVLGRVGPLALLFIAWAGSFWYVFNHYITISLLDAVDYAGPMTVHLFGAVFGVACGTVMYLPVFHKASVLKPFRRDRMPAYFSNVYAIVGTLILFITFPSFNAALAPDLAQFRVAINTIVAICASVVMAFVASRTFWGGKFHMLDVQHATIAGGISIAAATAQCVTPGGAAVVGAAAGLVSAVGYAVLTPLAERHFGLVDESGVLSGHFLPGLLGGCASILSVAVATSRDHIFGQEPTSIFPQGGDQAGHQAACLAISFGIALGGGILTGLLLFIFNWSGKKIMPRLRMHIFYSDDPYWLVPSDFERTILSDGTEVDEERELVSMH